MKFGVGGEYRRPVKLVTMAASVKTERAAEVGPASFKVELSKWSAAFSQSLATLLEQIGSPVSARSLERELKASYTTCWRVIRMAQAVDCAAESHHAPTPGELKPFLALAGQHGASGAASQAAMNAAEQFRAFVRRHAEDRQSFNAMVARQGNGQRETSIVRDRRAAYRDLAKIWGLQTDLQVCTFIVGPVDASEARPIVKLTLQRGVRRLRSDAQVTLMKFHTRDMGRPSGLPLNAQAAERYGMPLLPQFSSNDLPKVDPVTMEGGWQLYNLVGGEVGLQSNIEFAFGEHLANFCAGAPIWSISFTHSGKPIALLVMDLLIHRASHPGIEPQSIMYQHQEADFTLATALRSQRVPGSERVELVGPADALVLGEAPRYAELLQYATGIRKWFLADFDAYRIRIPFPVIGSNTLVYYYVGQEPNGGA